MTKVPEVHYNGDKATSQVDSLRQDIVQTREALGETVEALAHKVDVKAQAEEKLTAGRAELGRRTDAAVVAIRGAQPWPTVAAGVALVLVTALVWWRLARRRG